MFAAIRGPGNRPSASTALRQQCQGGRGGEGANTYDRDTPSGAMFAFTIVKSFDTTAERD